MFLNTLILRNKSLITVANNFHKKGLLEPNTYVIDFDAVIQNAKLILEEAKKYEIEVFFITKQIGFNPLIAKELIKLGYRGAVCVDYQELDVMLKNNIPVMHCGHLVQIPKSLLEKAVNNVEYITVYSLEKIKEINKVAKTYNKVQKIYLRVCEKRNIFYEGQQGGFALNDISNIINQIRFLENIEIIGLTSFPCFLYDSKLKKIIINNNIKTLMKAKDIIENLGIRIKIMNLPSNTCIENMKRVKILGGNQVEVGHGLTGTTPLHSKDTFQPEIPAILYLSEISHNYEDNSYFYGGGYYRRSNWGNLILGKDIAENNFNKIYPINIIDNSVIDYYLNFKGSYEISQSVIGSFRTQIFVTRSKVAIIKGINSKRPEILGIYNSIGNKIA